jgi:hypothetical protein
MKKIRLTEKDLTNIIKKVIKENELINEGRLIITNIEDYIANDGGIKIVETKDGGKIKLQRKGNDVIFVGQIEPSFIYGNVMDL